MTVIIIIMLIISISYWTPRACYRSAPRPTYAVSFAHLQLRVPGALRRA